MVGAEMASGCISLLCPNFVAGETVRMCDSREVTQRIPRKASGEVSERLITRRRVLGAGVGAVSGSLTAACGAGSNTPSAETNSRSTLPAYKPWKGISPDLESRNGSAPGFLAYPADPPTFSSSAPATGGEIRALTILAKPPVQVDRNEYWQHLNKAVGATLHFEGAPNANYPAKFQTLMAGGDLPDLMQVRFTIPRIPRFLDARCHDLTDFLAGESIARYPGLANIPTESWKAAVYNGRIYGVPCPSNSLFSVPVVRGDAVTSAGMSANVSNGEEFIELLRALNNPRANQWATTVPFDMLGHVNQMVGTPNVWSEVDGHFRRDYETEQIKQALSILTRMWKEQLFHPDSFISSKVQSNILTWFMNGTVKMWVASPYWGNNALQVQAQDQTHTVIPMLTPTWEGGAQAGRYVVRGAVSITALRQASTERIEELLRVIDWFAAPFGTKEYLVRRFGLQGPHYQLNGTDPILTDRGKSEVIATTSYVGTCLNPHYLPGRPDLVKTELAAEADGLAKSVPLPTISLYSPTDDSEGPAADAKMRDLQADIIQGRKPLSEWDVAVTSWKQSVGDRIRAEYEKGYAQSR